MNIAVIGWGSLIWNPGKLDIETEWRTDGPKLPIEFARVSNGDRLTLVLVDGAPLQTTLWSKSRKTTLADAVKDLQTREGTSEPNIGRWAATQTLKSHGLDVVQIISVWATNHALDGVVWTALGPKMPDGNNGLASNDEYIGYLNSLVANERDQAAREYIENAPVQIDTPMRRRIRETFGWK